MHFSVIRGGYVMGFKSCNSVKMAECMHNPAVLPRCDNALSLNVKFSLKLATSGMYQDDMSIKHAFLSP